MAIEKMELVTMVGLMQDLDETLLKCCESKCFHMEKAFGSTDNKNIKMLNEKNPYSTAFKGIYSLASNLGIHLKETDYANCKLETAENFESFFNGLDSKINALTDEKQKALKAVSEENGAVIQLNHLKGMHADFQKIFHCNYVSVRVGKLPIDNYPKLDFYDQNFFFVPFDTDKNFYWGMYFCPASAKELVDETFRSLYFERIHIPDFVSGSAEEAFDSLNKMIGTNQKKVDELTKQINEFSADNTNAIQQAFSKIKFLHDTFELRKRVGIVRGKFYIKGFIPFNEKDRFEKLFGTVKSISLVYMPADSDASCPPPTILKNSFITRPFRMLVEMYGLPVYGGFNPTAFVAITYSLLFGIMFGDLGQGLLIFVLGLIIGKKMSKDVGGMMTRCGLSSMIFGTLYGSVFGFEDLLDPIYENLGISVVPLEIFSQTNFILLTAVGIGIALIIISIIINIYIGFCQHDYEKAIFGCNGIAGLIFYSSIIVAVIGTMMLDMEIMSTPFVIFLIVIPAICIFCRVPFSIAVKYKEFKLSADEDDMKIGGFIVENFFEMFEFVLSYVSNTMSFLRVGGFVLSHAGMMLVVMTLMEGVGATAQPLVIIFGNAFVMVMEGMIVAIQIIRLEFYEIFSRFYEGDGKQFEPVGVSFSAGIE